VVQHAGGEHCTTMHMVTMRDQPIKAQGMPAQHAVPLDMSSMQWHVTESDATRPIPRKQPHLTAAHRVWQKLCTH
jgi:hypothetical protein